MGLRNFFYTGSYLKYEDCRLKYTALIQKTIFSLSFSSLTWSMLNEEAINTWAHLLMASVLITSSKYSPYIFLLWLSSIYGRLPQKLGSFRNGIFYFISFLKFKYRPLQNEETEEKKYFDPSTQHQQTKCKGK